MRPIQCGALFPVYPTLPVRDCCSPSAHSVTIVGNHLLLLCPTLVQIYIMVGGIGVAAVCGPLVGE